MDPLVYCTLRSIAEQDALYAQSRTKPGKRVTNAKGGSSAHNFGYALDFVPLIGGKPNWTPGSNHYLRCVRIAEECGMESASKWKSLKEWPHLQEPNWRSIVQ
jgi:peptidoglycan L-alanyl-D-glutamate endopeptidase CwlK